jgi:SAM-dependent methyltransferase
MNMAEVQPSIGSRFSLARRILESHYNQPATALWRVFEVEVVLARLRGSGRGLDLGCGDGELAEVMLSKMGVRWTGLDIDPDDAKLARARGVYESVHVAPAWNIPEPDASFDLVFSNSVLEHVDNLDDVLAEVARVLKPGGRLVFTVPLREFDDLLLWRRALARVRLREMAQRYAAAIDKRLVHRNLLSEEAWRERLAALGMETIEAVPYLSSSAIAVWETMSNATGGLLSLLTGRHPREVQRRAGLLNGRKPGAAAVASVLMLPALLVASAGASGPNGALYLEARLAGRSY